MNIVLTAVYDQKVKSYMQLIPSRTVEEAIRGFKGAVQKGDSDFSAYAEDYSLWVLGSYDQVSGEIFSQKPSLVAQALEFKNKSN